LSAYPSHTLSDLGGTAHALASFWAQGPTLILHGHRTCGTTRLTLPFVDRLYRRRTWGAVVAVLQDTPEEAGGLARELGLALPVLLEPDPYLLAAELGLDAVPTLTLVDSGGEVRLSTQGFKRTDLEAFAKMLGVEGSLFTPGDKAPAQRPG
jgi:hypothetical protein